MTLIPFGKKEDPEPERFRIPEKYSVVEESLIIQKVSIFAEDGPNGKSLFSIHLEFDSESNPSNRQRRTVQISGLTLGVEEKEIPVLARLAGRSLSIFLEKSNYSISQEHTAQENEALRAEVVRLTERNRVLSENLHTMVEESFKVS